MVRFDFIMYPSQSSAIEIFSFMVLQKPKYSRP
jgi:hypothetical protein